MEMFQSFTEGELKHVIDALVRRKAERNPKQSKRTKRAKKGSTPCSIHNVEVKINQLGLGYVSDETVLFRYCSGKCVGSRQNYDLALKILKSKNLLAHRAPEFVDSGISDRARHIPCCRPKDYEPDFGFLDNHNGYKFIHKIFAQKCECVWHHIFNLYLYFDITCIIDRVLDRMFGKKFVDYFTIQVVNKCVMWHRSCKWSIPNSKMIGRFIPTRQNILTSNRSSSRFLSMSEIYQAVSKHFILKW